MAVTPVEKICPSEASIQKAVQPAVRPDAASSPSVFTQRKSMTLLAKMRS
jgi:hypothetical protein